MRIITGRFKGANLFTVEGNTTRPTTDYSRELIFSVYSDYKDKRVLDLYAGTGSFGLEALSRGAKYVDFVEFSSKAIAVIIQNTQKLRCSDECHIHRRKVHQYLKDSKAKYDVIFLDPPYNKNLLNPTLEMIFENDVLNPDGIVIAEHTKQEAVSEAMRQYIIGEKIGKSTSFTLFSKP